MIGNLFEKKRFGEMREQIKWDNGQDIEKILKKITLSSGITAMFWVIIADYLNISGIIIVILFFCIIILPAMLVFLLGLYLLEKNVKKKESETIDALLQASTYPNESSIEHIIEGLSLENSLLGKEFKSADCEIRNGASVDDALRDIIRRNKSRIIEDAIMLFMQANRSKADNSKLFREHAEHLLEMQALNDEKRIALMIQKYTLILGGAIIVPVVLSMLMQLMAGFDFSSLGELYPNSVDKRGLLEVIRIANVIYLVEYCIIASAFIARLEGNSRKAVIYAMLLLPVALISYFFGHLVLKF